MNLNNSGFAFFAGLIMVVQSLGSAYAEQPDKHDNSKFVNPFIGTGGTGHTYPGATAPFGMVQVSPETNYFDWKYCSGYNYSDSVILGFSHTHLSGTGAMDLGDILMMPFTDIAKAANPESRFSHSSESAKPGYYSVNLLTNNIKAELTASVHSAYHRYTQLGSGPIYLLIDLQHGIVPEKENLYTHVQESHINIEDSHTLSGYTITNGWAGIKHVYFVISLKEGYKSVKWIQGQNENRNQKIVLEFDNLTNNQANIKIALSTVSIEGAKNNLKCEIGNKSFDHVLANTQKSWKEYLGRVDIEADQKHKEIFYTSLYHLLIVPNNIADCDSNYRGADNKIYKSPWGTYYSTFSLWDTYRAANPLYTLLYPEKTNEFVKTMLAHYQVQGFLPIWTLWGHENFCMIGNHAVPVIADAFLKGIGDFDPKLAYEAVKTTVTTNHEKSDWDKYLKYGYLPSDLVPDESVSRTLEMAFDDWCVGQMAKTLGNEKDYAEFSRRANFYKNLYDKSAFLMRGKKSDGTWVTPFDKLGIAHAGTAGGDYTEGNAWQYTWSVQHDVEGLISLMGGNQNFVERLDSLFLLPSKVEGKGATVDISGLIGQYVHGNEPSHHVIYVYALAGRPDKTNKLVDQIMNTLYNNTPEGLCGNEDCGQMSAWYVFNALGFYPVNPANGNYVFGSPQVKKATLHLTNGKDFVINTGSQPVSGSNTYKIILNGKETRKNSIPHQEILNGGKLSFEPDQNKKN